MAVTWPLPAALDAIPLNPNYPFHALAVRHLATGGSPLWWQIMPFPEGQPLALLGGLTVLLGALLGIVFSTVVATNLGLVLSLTINIFCVMWFAASRGWKRGAQAATGAAAILTPFLVGELANGRFENVAPGAFALVLLSLQQRGWRMPAMALAGLLWAAFSSPYMAIPAGLLLLFGALNCTWRTRITALAVVALTAGLVYLYYLPITTMENRGISSGPVSIGSTPIPLAELILPMADPQRQGEDAKAPASRLDVQRWQPKEVDFQIPARTATLYNQAYLGGGLLLFGLIGLALGRRDRVLAAASAAGLICLCLALGDQLLLTRELQTDLRLPWHWVQRWPGIGRLLMINRLLMGTCFVLALGVGRLCAAVAAPRASDAWAALVLVLLILDLGWYSRVPWPIQAARFRTPAALRELPGEAVALWTGRPCLNPKDVELLALLTGRAVSLYGGFRLYLGDSPETTRPGKFEVKESPAAWLHRVNAAGAMTWLRVLNLKCAHRGPMAPVAPAAEQSEGTFGFAPLPAPGSGASVTSRRPAGRPAPPCPARPGAACTP